MTNVMLKKPDGGLFLVPGNVNDRLFRERGFEFETVPKELRFDPGDPLADGAWRDQPCYVVGSGLSTEGFDWNRLRGERVIAVNMAFMNVPWADVSFSMDGGWLLSVMAGRYGQDVLDSYNAFQGEKLHVNIDWLQRPAGLREIRPYAILETLSPSIRDGLGRSTNSGFGAVNLALTLGANTIYLIGFDMLDTGDGPDHLYSDPDGMRLNGNYPAAIPAFEQVAKDIPAMFPGTRIINTNFDSGLKCFEFGRIPNR